MYALDPKQTYGSNDRPSAHMRRLTLLTVGLGLAVSSATFSVAAQVLQDSQCGKVQSKKERTAQLQGRDPRAMQREGYPDDPNVQYRRAKEIGSLRDAWGAIIMVQEGVGTKPDAKRADALWKDYWCSQLLPEFEGRLDLALVHLKAAAARGLPTAMIRLSEVYAKGEFGQQADERLAAEWKAKHDGAKTKQK